MRKLLFCAFFFLMSYGSYSQAGADSLLNATQNNTSDTTQLPENDFSLSQKDSTNQSDTLSHKQKRKKSEKRLSKKIKTKLKDTEIAKDSLDRNNNQSKSVAKKDSVSNKLKDKASNNKLNNNFKAKKEAVAGKGNDSTSSTLKDSVSNKLKNKAGDSELNKQFKSKYQGVVGIGKDSLAKDSIKNNLKNKTTDQLKNKMPGQFQGIAGKKDSLMNGGLGDTLKSKAKAKVNDVKDGVIEKKDSLLSQGKTKIKDAKTNTKSFVKTQVKAIRPIGSVSVGYEYGVIPFVAGDNYPSGGFKTEGRVSVFLFKVPVEVSYNYSTIKNTIGLNNYYRFSFDATRYKEELSQKMDVNYKANLGQLNKLEGQQQILMQKVQMLSFMKDNPSYKIPAVDGLKDKATSKLNSGSLKDSLGNSMPDTAGTLSSLKKPDANNLENLSKDGMIGNASSKMDIDKLKDSLGNNLPDTTGGLSKYKKPIPDSLKSYSEGNAGSNPDAKLNYSTKKDSVGNTPIDTSAIQSKIKTDSLNKYSDKLNGFKNNFSSKLKHKKDKDSLSGTSDSTRVNVVKPAKDSITVANDSIENATKDSIRTARKDSLNAEYVVCKEKYDSVNTEIEKVKVIIEKVKHAIEDPFSVANPYLSKAERFLGGIKKLEIGLCNPTYSAFLTNNIPVQGINIEYGKKDNFIAFTYGTTVGTLLYNTNTLQGTLQGARNLYNYFDFGNLSAGRKIICLKGGVGDKDETHLYAGFLLGKGRTDYMHPATDAGSSALSKESNLVVELDGKYKFSQQMSIDVILGKASVQENDLSLEKVQSLVSEVFSSYRSYAFLTKLNLSIRKTNTKLTFSTRWIDPYFKSFGLGFLRSDNLRYEAKAEQQITKKIKYSIAYRKEEDNLLKLYNYKNTLQSINNSLNIKLNRRFNIRLNYIPLFRELKSESVTIKDRNQIITAIVSYTPRAKKISSQFNALYSNYLVNSDSGNINFENFTYTQQLQFKSGFKTGLNASWFKNSLQDTLGNDTWLGIVDIGYAAKKGGSISLGGKMAYKEGMEIQYGFIVKASVKVYKGLFWEAEAEKILIGDYYNSFIIGQIKKFPYYCNTRLVLTF